MWMMPLHLQVNQKSYYDYDYDDLEFLLKISNIEFIYFRLQNIFVFFVCLIILKVLLDYKL